MSAPALTPHLCAHCGQPLPQRLPDAAPLDVASARWAAAEEVITALADELEEPALRDGVYAWPFHRPAMASARWIRIRMAEDLGSLLREAGACGVVTRDDLARLGWTGEQIAAHADAALSRASDTAEEAA